MTDSGPDVAGRPAPGPTEWGETTGVGPWDGDPPDDPRYDPTLLREGDTRNVVDTYRYWTREAIVADIDQRRHPLHIAIENFGNDANIGAVVRTANAFAVDTVHIVGRRRWNRRGAMVTDRYQRLRHHDTTADLARRAHPFHVAIENLGHDHNIGTVVRTANAFAAGGVHIVGRRRWNRRGAMVTDRYLRLHHHADVDGLAEFAAAHGLTVVAVDNTPGSVRLETAELPRECLLLFGQEGPGLSGPARELASLSVSIAQFGSTRSINAGVAAGVAMHAWIRRHADLDAAW